MPGLPVINSPAPSTIPAQAESPLPNSFLGLLHFNAPGGPSQPWPLRAKTINWNAATGVMADPDDSAHTRDRNYADARTLAAQYPVVAITFAGVLVCAGLLDYRETANDALTAANRLADSDATKAAKVAAATAALASAEGNLSIDAAIAMTQHTLAVLQAEKALAVAESLPDSDGTKAQRVADALAALQALGAQS